MSLSIRRGLVTDATIVAEFNRRLAWETENKKLDGKLLQAGVTSALSDSSRAVYYLACDDTQVVGQLMLTLEWSDWRDAWFWWIQSVYVDKEYRQQGVYRSLYQHVVSLATNDDGVCGIRLYVEKDNQRAQRTYQKLGMDTTDYFIMEELL